MLCQCPSIQCKNQSNKQQTRNATKTRKHSRTILHLLCLSKTPMHLPRLWTDAPVAKNKSRGEQNNRGSKGSTQGTKKNTSREKEEKEKTAKHNGTEGPSGNQRRGRREGRGGQGGEGCTHHIRIATVQLSGVVRCAWIIITVNTSEWPN